MFYWRCINRDESSCVAVFTPSESGLPWCGMLCFSLLSVPPLLDRINCMSPAATAVALLLGKMYSMLLCYFAVSASHSCFFSSSSFWPQLVVSIQTQAEHISFSTFKSQDFQTVWVRKERCKKNKSKKCKLWTSWVNSKIKPFLTLKLSGSCNIYVKKIQQNNNKKQNTVFGHKQAKINIQNLHILMSCKVFESSEYKWS